MKAVVSPPPSPRDKLAMVTQRSAGGRPCRSERFGPKGSPSFQGGGPELGAGLSFSARLSAPHPPAHATLEAGSGRLHSSRSLPAAPAGVLGSWLCPALPGSASSTLAGWSAVRMTQRGHWGTSPHGLTGHALHTRWARRCQPGTSPRALPDCQEAGGLRTLLCRGRGSCNGEGRHLAGDQGPGVKVGILGLRAGWLGRGNARAPLQWLTPPPISAY